MKERGVRIKGQIQKALSGFYYVEVEGVIYQTRGRGNFRAKKQTPLVGDYVTFHPTNEQEGVILALHERKNTLVRPPICNIDSAVIVMSCVEPDFSTYLLDRYIVTLEQLAIEPIIYITKCDLLKGSQSIQTIAAYYRRIGYEVILSNEENNLSTLKKQLSNKLTVLMGQSGAGKSTLLNKLLPDLVLETAEISMYLNRGKHTTRHVEIHPIDDCRIADTPGFSALDLQGIAAEELGDYFVELNALSQQCKFRGCYHQQEPHCAVKEAIEKDALLNERYTHYTQFLEEIKKRKVIYEKEGKK